MRAQVPERRRRLVALSNAAEQYDISVKTLRRRIADGTLTGYKLGPRLLRVDLDELESSLSKMPAARR